MDHIEYIINAAFVLIFSGVILVLLVGYWYVDREYELRSTKRKKCAKYKKIKMDQKILRNKLIKDIKIFGLVMKQFDL